MRADEELGRSREVVDVFKNEVMEFTCVLFLVQDDGTYSIGLDDSPDTIDLCIIPPFYGFVLCVELKVGVYVVSAS